jgi:dienelactone hydrolase
MVVVAGCAAILAVAAPAQATGPDHPSIIGAERTVVLGNVAHYRFTVRVGAGPFDVIQVHRVVKERRPYLPAPRMEGVMLLPGAPQLFEAIFLPPAAPGVQPEKASVALFLASNGVDVWGMDYGWTAVPREATDFSALQGWGIDKDATHTEIALSIARWIRGLSWQGVGPIHLLGFSYGGFLVYAVAGEDSQRPRFLRNVKGIIPVDEALFKSDVATEKANGCNAAAAAQAKLGTDTYQSGPNMGALNAQLALEQPDVLSSKSIPANPFFPAIPAYTFTNYQWPLASNVGTMFLGGSYAAGPPASVELFFTTGPRFLDLLLNTPAWTSVQSAYDIGASRCDAETYPVTFDDHLGEVVVPIFAVARRDQGRLYTTSLTSSTDVSWLWLNEAFTPSGYGHADFFLANEAATVVWQPILEWVRAHR